MNLSTALSKCFPKKSSLLDNGNCCTLVFDSLLESVFPKIIIIYIYILQLSYI